MIFLGLMNSLQGRTDENIGDYILLLVVGSFCESLLGFLICIIGEDNA